MDEMIELVYEIKSGKDCPQCSGELRPHEHANGQDLTACNECGAVFCNGKLISDAWAVSKTCPWHHKKTANTIVLESQLRRHFSQVDIYESVHGFLRIRIVDLQFLNMHTGLRWKQVRQAEPVLMKSWRADRIWYALMSPAEQGYSRYYSDLSEIFTNDT